MILLMLLPGPSLPSQLSPLPGAAHASPSRAIPASRPQTTAACRAAVSAVSPRPAPPAHQLSPALPAPPSRLAGDPRGGEGSSVRSVPVSLPAGTSHCSCLVTGANEGCGQLRG